ncbi:anti-sigma factor domain-containing protein [Agromyces sp. NPDC004153]
MAKVLVDGVARSRQMTLATFAQGVAAERTEKSDELIGAAIGSPMRNTGSRRRSPWWPVVAAATVVGVLIGFGVGAATHEVVLNPWGPAATVIASTKLDRAPGGSPTGTAVIEQDHAGLRWLKVDLDAKVPVGDVREVWLIRSDSSGYQSLGLLLGISGRFVVPDGIDLREYTLVDVSAEPADGNPDHSGDSIVSGKLARP